MEGEKVVKNKKWLEEKWWYRFLKVGYILFFAIFFLLGSIGVFEEFPHRDSYFISPSESSVECSDGKSFKLSQIEPNYGEYRSISDNQSDTEFQNAATQWCSGNPFATTISPPNADGFIPYEPKTYKPPTDGTWSDRTGNYSIKWVYIKEGSWIGFVSSLFGLIVSTLLCFWIFKGIFYYIVIGRFNLK